ncbi:MAG TPA: hypothetical protein EYG98_01365 [Sulfurovum sp.]|nr:hypothetical protein [Sulfurovum sp.]
MRLKTTTLSQLVNFLLGIAWAIAVIGAVSTFLSFLKINFFIAILSTILGAVPGLLMVLFLEYLILKSEKLEELKKQTDLLKKLQSRTSI